MTREELACKNSWILAVIRDRCELTKAEKDYLNILIEALAQKPPTEPTTPHLTVDEYIRTRNKNND